VLRLGRARLPEDARRDMKIKPKAVHEKCNDVPSEARRVMFEV